MFDADQVARPNFFTRTLPWLQDGKETIVLTPQVGLSNLLMFCCRLWRVQ